MGRSRARASVGNGMVDSSSSSGIFLQGDVESQSLGNSANSVPGNMCSNMVPVYGDMNNSIGASSLVTDSNSGFSGGGGYMRLPASPLSFNSDNISISGSSVIDGPSGMHSSSNQDPCFQQVGPCQGGSTATSLPPPRARQVSLPNGSRVLGSFFRDNDNISHLQKKPRLDIKQEDIMQQQVLQHILQMQDSMQLQNPNAQLQTLIQQQRLREQQQIFQALPPLQRAHLIQQQQQQELQLRKHLQQQSLQPANAVKRPYDDGVCSRRLMQYLFHQRKRPADNSISYWRKFVAEYYSPRAKKRWCLSLYDNVGHHSLGVFPQAARDSWQCDICRSKSGRGFEATVEVLPRLNEIKFGSGVIDELLFLDLPREYRFPSGVMVLEYGHAVQESIYEQLRVVCEGQLKIIFTPDLKILTWEFCARRHEEFLPRRLIAPQVNQLLQVAQKCQSVVTSGSNGVSQQDLQANSNMIVMAGRQLGRSLELQSVNDLGFSKRYIRCLQISEVVNSMKDLMDFCHGTKTGPIDGLKSFLRKTNPSNFNLHTQKMQDMDQVSSKLVSLNPGVNSSLVNNSHYMGNCGSLLTGSALAALAPSSYQNMLMRQNSMNSNSRQEASSSFNNSNENGYLFHGSTSMPVGGFHQSPHSGGHAIQQHMIRQLLQDISTGGGGGLKPSVSGSMDREGLRYGISSSVTSPLPPVVPTRSNSFKGASQSDSSAGGGTGSRGVGSRKMATDLPHLCFETKREYHAISDAISDMIMLRFHSTFKN
ncbi:hypothetical protein SSX86_020353 [Deinandra increscens subsp. villosa]|uniref:Transcriptional regulator SLK2 n=1 Tax=Deinandra increscens subsp. villosa TaxID=3103831 RepID=A0AAP0CUS2_9ASTR